jgi:hypothetical protein
LIVTAKFKVDRIQAEVNIGQSHVQIDGRTMLGLRYNDIAPLENHHSSVAAMLLNDPRTNPFGNMTLEQFKELRRGMITCILATEMSRHKEFIESLQVVAPVFDIHEIEHKVRSKSRRKLWPMHDNQHDSIISYTRQFSANCTPVSGYRQVNR